MAKQDGTGLPGDGLCQDIGLTHRTAFAIDKPYRETGVDQRTANRQETERRQLFLRDPAADRRMWNIDQKYAQSPIPLRFETRYLDPNCGAPKA